MSEPLSDDDIEDVVSSVRRLVSPEARPRPMSRDLGVDRLILTPSLRVVAEQPPGGQTVVTLETVVRKSRAKAKRKADTGAKALVGQEPFPEADAVLAKDAQDFGSSGLSLAEMVLGAEVADVLPVDPMDEAESAKPRKIASRRPGGEKAGSKATTALKPVAARSRAVKASGAAKPTRAGAKTEAAPGIVATPVAAKPKARPRPAPAKPASAKAAEKGANPAKAARSRTKPAGSSGTKTKASVKAKPPAARRITVRPNPLHLVDQVAPMPVVTMVELSAPEMPEPVADEIAAALVPEPVAFLPEMETVFAGTPAETPLEPAMLADVPIENMAPGLTDADGNEISLLDEEALIAMVRQVIREELQGVLGEKITRNVRKLVRAEIARALTAQTLE